MTKKNILFYNYKYYKGADIFFRFKMLRVDIKNAFHRALYGYCHSEVFEFYLNFIVKNKILLKELKKDDSYPYPYTYDEWQTIIGKMIDLLNIMEENEGNFDTDIDIKAKDEFFKLFSENFYYLWT